MNILNKNRVKKDDLPIRVIQFGEGNFLRGFVDYMLDIANEKGVFSGSVMLVKPIEYGNLDNFHEQDYLYTVSLRGLVEGEAKETNRIITSIAGAVDCYTEYAQYAELARLDTLRFVVSNTTEAGIVYDETDCFEYCPPKTYPGKLTKFLFERYEFFSGDLTKGLIILPVELIDDNGIHLKEDVIQLAKLWGLKEDFLTWIEKACVFCSTLVDRIITGFPKDETDRLWKEYGYRDQLIVTGEPFALWVIESDKKIEDELPLNKAGLPVIFTDNQKPYKQRKVRILNGAHTSFVLASYLSGNDFVLESMEDGLIRNFMVKTIYDEIIPTLDLPKEDLISFAQAVETRFENPYIKHALLSISLNSVSKWRARCMPSLLEYSNRFHQLPIHLTFSLAALMSFYSSTEFRDGALIGRRDGAEYRIMDDKEVLEFFVENSDQETQLFVAAFLSKEAFWGQDLTKLTGLAQTVTENLEKIKKLGMRDALLSLEQ